VAAAAHHAGTKSAQAQAAAQQQSEQLQAQPAPPPEAPPPAAPVAAEVDSDMVAQLENLKKLLDEGVLTQDEFDAQKQKILAAS
jgi:hypothetical protein